MHNVSAVTKHLRAKCIEQGIDETRHCLRLVHPPDQPESAIVEVGDRTFRMYNFIENSLALLTARSDEEAYQTGWAVGRFQADLSDLAPEVELFETIPHFHNTPRRVEALHEAVRLDPLGRVASANKELEAVEVHLHLAKALVDRLKSGELPVRPVHNDAKISNVLFDAHSSGPLCVVDLDTVMPGSTLFDTGEMLRSMSSHTSEDARRGAQVELLPGRIEAITTGFRDAMGDLLSDLEISLLITSGQVLSFENGVRFLTDYLTGDKYFRATRTRQNLDRASTQLDLTRALSNY